MIDNQSCKKPIINSSPIIISYMFIIVPFALAYFFDYFWGSQAIH